MLKPKIPQKFRKIPEIFPKNPEISGKIPKKPWKFADELRLADGGPASRDRSISQKIFHMGVFWL